MSYFTTHSVPFHSVTVLPYATLFLSTPFNGELPIVPSTRTRNPLGKFIAEPAIYDRVLAKVFNCVDILEPVVTLTSAKVL